MAKAKSKTFEVFGEFRYHKGFPQNRDMKGPDGADWADHGGMYITDMILDETNMETVRDSGTELKIRTNKDRHCDFLDDDHYLVKFRRAHEHSIADFCGPPMNVLADGTPIDPEEGFGIGNGSEGYLQFTVYPTQLRNGTRWEGTQVTKWVQYPLSTSGAHFIDRGETAISAAEEDDDGPTESVKKTTKASPKSTKKVISDDIEDDEIPF